MRIVQLICSFIFFSPFFCLGQSAYQDIRDGNKAYQENDYKKAEDFFRESIRKDGKPMESSFNLGDALYRQGKYEDAGRYFNMAAEKAEDKITKSEAYHNLGNALLKSEKYNEAVIAYKNALINNSKDEDSRYNLAYAKQKLQQQQQQEQEKEDQDKEKKKEEENKDEQENKDQEKEEEEEEEKENEEQDQEEKEEEEQKEQQQQQQQKEEQISREDAERILENLNEQEKDLQEKLKKQKIKEVDVSIEKDW